MRSGVSRRPDFDTSGGSSVHAKTKALIGLLLTASAVLTVAPSATAAPADRARRTAVNTLTVSPTASVGKPVTASGKVSTTFKRTVQLQLLAGTVWKPVATSRTYSRGAFSLADTVVLGPTTNLAFLRDVLAHPAFASGATHTGFLGDHLPAWHPSASPALAAALAALATTRSTAARGGDNAGPRQEPSPWETLGRWRLAGT